MQLRSVTVECADLSGAGLPTGRVPPGWGHPGSKIQLDRSG